MTRHIPKSLYGAMRKLPVFIFVAARVWVAGQEATAQISSTPKDVSQRASQSAYVDFLTAEILAADGSKPEALRRLAESLRLQPQGNPASDLVFELLSEQRTNGGMVLRGHAGAVVDAEYSTDGTKIVTASEDQTARLWDAQTGRELTPPLHHDDAVLVASFSPDGKRVVTGSEDETAKIWDVATGRQVGLAMRTTGAIRCVKFSPDGKKLATGSDEGRARIWDASTGQPLSPEVVYHEAVYSITFSPDGSRVLTATGDGVADLLDSKTGARELKPLRHNNIIFGAAFSPDGNIILTGSADHTAKTWYANTAQPLGPIFQHSLSIVSAAFNRDASRLVTASLDHTAMVWDAKTGKPISPPLQHSEAVLRALFSPDGNLVATACRDHTARVWNASSGEQLHLPVRTLTDVPSIAFSPSGVSLLTASGDSSVQIIDMAPHDPAPEWLADLADFAATQIKYKQAQKPDLARIRLLRTKLLDSKSNEPWVVFGRWYFSESAVRPISPWSTISLEKYVESLIDLGDRDSLNYAKMLSFEHPTWVVKIMQLMAKLPPVPEGAAGTEKLAR